MQQEQHENEIALDSHNVMQFLRSNPDFFDQHIDVLSKLKIPHHTGGAVSLIEKQVSVLRNKCSSLENKLTELIQVATENEKLQNRLHLLTQEVVSAGSLDDVITLTRESLIENFHADDVKVLLVDSEGSKQHLQLPERFIAFDDPGLSLFDELYDSCQTSCGSQKESVREFLFGDNAEAVGSAAIIPLYHKRKLGLAVLSSKDVYRFESGKGVMFLNQLGEVLSRRILGFMEEHDSHECSER